MKHKLKLKSLELSDLKPMKMPQKLVPAPDYEALLAHMRKNNGWAVIRTDPNLDRRTTSGSTEAPLVKAFNSHVRTTLKKALFTRRLALDAWYLELKG
jgi:uncharacterized short protein YbdD (DUF466 family)